MSATDQYIKVLTQLKPGDLGLLCTHAGQGLDESVDAFDLFTGLWWPLRQKSQRAPRRQVAWLIAKLYASAPIPQSPGDKLAIQLSRCLPNEKKKRKRLQNKFDELLLTGIDDIETPLRWALGEVSKMNCPSLDWVQLTDDLSYWNHESKRLEWANDFLYNK